MASVPVDDEERELTWVVMKAASHVLTTQSFSMVSIPGRRQTMRGVKRCESRRV